ncbi:hypothetical protein PT286_04435 [Neisseriaceae bacterium ESL0693]|nr:hypothetical protein [Neisseriaceae bacterium ESL0693]
MSCMVVNEETINALISVLIDSKVFDKNDTFSINKWIYCIRKLNLQSVLNKRKVSIEEMEETGEYVFKYYHWNYKDIYDRLQIAWLAAFVCYQCTNSEDYDDHPIVKVFKLIQAQTIERYIGFLIESGRRCAHGTWWDKDLTELPIFDESRVMKWGF